jgi:integrase
LGRKENQVADPIKKITLSGGRVRYRFVLDVGRDEDGRRKQLTKTYDTKKEARAEYARIKHEVDGGRFVAPTGLTVNKLLDLYELSEMIDVEKATALNTTDALKPVRRQYGSRPAQELTEENVNDLVSWMLTSGRRRGGKAGTGLSVRTVQLTLTRLKAALVFGVRRKLLTHNVAEYTKIPREARNKAAAVAEKRKPWVQAEVTTFLAAIRHVRLYAVVLLLLMGLRPAEVCGLRWADVDLVTGRLHVRSTRTIVGREVEEKGPKSENGRRGLPLPKLAVTALMALRKRQAREQLKAGDGYAASGYVLVDEAGLPWRTDKLRREVYRLMKVAAVRKVRPYDARHACLTYLATSGVADVVVSAWAGHADLSFTKRVYVHPDIEHLQAAADQLDKLLA